MDQLQQIFGSAAWARGWGNAGQRVGHFRPAADVVKARRRNADGPDQQEHRLDALRQHHGQQAADHRVDAGQHAQHDDEEHHGGDAHHGRLRTHAQHAAQDQRRRVEGHADVDHQRRKDRNHREPIAAVAIESPLQEIGQRRHARTKIKRGKQQGQHDENEPGHPLEVAVDHAVLVGRFGEADQMHRRDIGGEHCQPDDRPCEGVAGEEVVAPLPPFRLRAPTQHPNPTTATRYATTMARSNEEIWRDIANLVQGCCMDARRGANARRGQSDRDLLACQSTRKGTRQPAHITASAVNARKVEPMLSRKTARWEALVVGTKIAN